MGINQNSSVNRLVLELKKGSVLAFNIIYARYALQLLNYVGAATERKEDAEEIVHDIFINKIKRVKFARAISNSINGKNAISLPMTPICHPICFL